MLGRSRTVTSMSKRRHRSLTAKDWAKADKVVPKQHEIIPEIERVMQCQNEYFTAGAVWKRINGHWQCVQAAQIIKWMKGMDVGAAKMELARLGCDYTWVGM